MVPSAIWRVVVPAASSAVLLVAIASLALSSARARENRVRHATSTTPAIEVDELTKTYDEVEAVRGVSFTVARGETNERGQELPHPWHTSPSAAAERCSGAVGRPQRGHAR
jgi:hypothetical protein